MRCALLLRGYAFRQIGVLKGWGVDWRKSIDSQRKYLVAPLREKYERVDTILCTYESRGLDLDALQRDYDPSVMVAVPEGRQQREMALLALDTLIEMQGAIVDYDLVVMTRFDLEFLKSPFEGMDTGKVNFLWREWNEKAWEEHRRVPDAIHMMPGSLVKGFRDGVAVAPSNICLHTIYYPVAERIGEDRIHIINRNGYTDSNTDIQNNPIYKMVRVLS